MKKILIILLATISITAYSQRVYTDSIKISDISGTDTTIFIDFRTESGSSIIFDFSNFDADDATLNFGYSNDGIGMVAIDDSRNPFTLSTLTYAIEVNGDTYSKLGLSDLKWSYKYIAFKLTKNSVSSGTFIWRFVR